MLSCINKDSYEFQTLKQRSGLNEFMLEAVCRRFVSEYNRFPYLDELPNSNSETNLREVLNIKNNSAKIQDILSFTGRDTIEEANISINNEFRDLETEIVPINQEALVSITHRPTITEEAEPVEQDGWVNNRAVISNAINKLASLYGINFIETNDYQLSGKVSDRVNAFILNGDIYINTDHASIDAPLHEMMHLLIGSIRFTNPNLYQNLVSLSTQFPNYQQLAKQYRNRSQNDINEEVFVTEVAKYLSGMKSNLDKMDKKTSYEIGYNIKRVLDTILMGQDSVKTISEDRLYKMSLRELATELSSTSFINTFKGTFNSKDSALHRRLNNEKSDLIKKNELQEVCQ